MRSKWSVVEPDESDVARNMKVELGKPEYRASSEVVVRTDDRIRWVLQRHQLLGQREAGVLVPVGRSPHKGGVVKPCVTKALFKAREAEVSCFVARRAIDEGHTAPAEGQEVLSGKTSAALVVWEDAGRVSGERVRVEVHEGDIPSYCRRCTTLLDLETRKDYPVHLLVEEKLDVLSFLRDA